jgi:hypothetical protein
VPKINPLSCKAIRSLAVAAIAVAATFGCAVHSRHPSDIDALEDVLGMDTGCDAEGCSACRSAGCEANGCGDDGASGEYCAECTCEGGDYGRQHHRILRRMFERLPFERNGWQGKEGVQEDIFLETVEVVHQVATLPRDTFSKAANGCTSNACPGPPNVPPPGRFHPVPTRPVFSPRFEPAPTGQVEYQ